MDIGKNVKKVEKTNTRQTILEVGEKKKNAEKNIR